MLLAAAIVLGAVVAVGAALGYRGAVVLTGSMRPAIAPGDLVVAKRVHPASLHVGDIVMFTDPQAAGRTLTHRVRAIDGRTDGSFAVTTRGDANTADEHWTSRPDASVGLVETVVPKAGYLTHWLADPTARLLAFLTIGLLMLFLGLRWVWREEPRG